MFRSRQAFFYGDAAPDPLPYIKEQFENPPRLLPTDRENLFELTIRAETVMAHLHSDVSRLGFILQLVYFRATHRFFPLSRFQREDAQYVITRFRLALEPEEIGAYPCSTHWDRHKIICSQPGSSQFTKTHREQLLQEAGRLACAHMRPEELFDYLICFLEERRIEIPSYRTFAELITNALLMVEKQLSAQLDQALTPVEEAWLDQLLQPHSDYGRVRVSLYKVLLFQQVALAIKSGQLNFVHSYQRSFDHYSGKYEFRFQIYLNNKFIISNQ